MSEAWRRNLIVFRGHSSITGMMMAKPRAVSTMHVGIAIVVVLLSWWQSVEAQVTTNTLIYGARGTSSNVGSEVCMHAVKFAVALHQRPAFMC